MFAESYPWRNSSSFYYCLLTFHFLILFLTLFFSPKPGAKEHARSNSGRRSPLHGPGAGPEWGQEQAWISAKLWEEFRPGAGKAETKWRRSHWAPVISFASDPTASWAQVGYLGTKFSKEGLCPNIPAGTLANSTEYWISLSLLISFVGLPIVELYL